ncbi:hypothetical protein G7Y89_g6480 [Cudoniella acicularis]|uniref:Uncharacterized protein n=1 Tax=Cudoniella acicularis TaxID=354080 RepID=A0A8H4RNS7_9HELO|nr:hypothetical protein G7Y89_g6480 [Cudoniella acicularis]
MAMAEVLYNREHHLVDRNLKKLFSAEVQERYAETWDNLDPKVTVLRERTIKGALDRVREIGDQNEGQGEGSIDFFPRAAIVLPYLENHRTLLSVILSNKHAEGNDFYLGSLLPRLFWRLELSATGMLWLASAVGESLTDYFAY